MAILRDTRLCTGLDITTTSTGEARLSTGPVLPLVSEAVDGGGPSYSNQRMNNQSFHTRLRSWGLKLTDGLS